MLSAYGARGMRESATFSLFVRELAVSRNFLVVCGLDDLLDELQALRFRADDIAYLRSLNMFPESLFDSLPDFRFAGDVFAVAEGTPMFPGEPNSRGHGANRAGAGRRDAGRQPDQPADGAGLESGPRCRGRRRASGRRFRRTARTRVRRGVEGRARVRRRGRVGDIAARRRRALPDSGGRNHGAQFCPGFRQRARGLHRVRRGFSEPRSFWRQLPPTRWRGCDNAIQLARRIGDNCRLTGIRFGFRRSRRPVARCARDAGRGRPSPAEDRRKRRAQRGEDKRSVNARAPIDMFGVGTEMSVATNAPSLDIAYKLTEFAGMGRMKLSAHKTTTPGRKQIYRQTAGGLAVRDVVARRDESCEGTRLLEPVMRGGVRLKERADLIDFSERRAPRWSGRCRRRCAPSTRRKSPIPSSSPIGCGRTRPTSPPA